MAGSGSALIGSLQYGSGIISSVWLALLPGESAFTMMGIIAVFAALCALTVARD